MDLKKLLAMAMALVLMLSILSGCSGSSTPEATEAAKPAANAGSSDMGEEDSNRVDAGRTVETNTSAVIDEINIGVQSDPTNWAPWAPPANGRTVAVLGCGLYQGFGYIVDDIYYPQLAKDYTISDDGLTITIHMFDCIKDHNGNKVDAHDAEWSFAEGLSLGYISNVSMVDSLKAVDDYTVEVKLKRILGVGEIDNIVGFNIVSQASYEASPEGMSTWAVGTGPYKLTEYTSGYSFTYSMNEDYWQTDPQYIGYRELQNVKEAHYYIIAESAQRAIALENGTIDMCAEISADDLPVFFEGGSQSDRYWTYAVYDNLCLYTYANVTEGHPTSDVNLRRAIFYAINSQAVVDSVFNGLAVTCYDYGSRWVQGYDPAWETEDNFYKYDLEKAKECLAASSYAGEELVILTEGTDDTSNTAALIQNMLINAGINCRIEAVEASILNTYRENPDNWDVLVMKYACSKYTIKGYQMSLDASRFSWGGTIGFVYDDTLQSMIDLCMTTAGNTQENIQTLHEYVIENAYGYNICNFLTNYVLSNKVTEVALTASWAIIPGACSYAAQ